jgi:uroporphyrinogen-III synthase
MNTTFSSATGPQTADQLRKSGFTISIIRESDSDSAVVVESLEGEPMQEVAELVVNRFERSAGVRATLLRVGKRNLIIRDGSRRILPFNLLMDPDPDSTVPLASLDAADEAGRAIVDSG